MINPRGRAPWNLNRGFSVNVWTGILGDYLLGPYCLTATRKATDTTHPGGGRYGNGIFHCILGVKKRASFRLTQIEQAEVLFCFVLRSETNSRLTKSA
ncbi:hypothetical protein AVEN_266335-1 [Araneus ventricosus]|uniref:Uncharacterized protein n=1 Tax=Araneus ventricosus TaxID=182803 RepID=A0A4Y2XDR4_ARAVE|nr:hypothetical protein AVEN_266335-1 [Araneus ventricosus]